MLGTQYHDSYFNGDTVTDALKVSDTGSRNFIAHGNFEGAKVSAITLLGKQDPILVNRVDRYVDGKLIVQYVDGPDPEPIRTICAADDRKCSGAMFTLRSGLRKFQRKLK